MEEARAFKKLKEQMGLSINKMAIMMGLNIARISNRLDLLAFEPEIQCLFKVRLVPGEKTKCSYYKEFIPDQGICPKCGKENKYRGVKGNRSAAIFNADDLVANQFALFSEGEFDCMVAWQELNQYLPCVTMGSATNVPDLTTWNDYLARPSYILAAYDNDIMPASRVLTR
jgi:hypothetical protein